MRTAKEVLLENIPYELKKDFDYIGILNSVNVINVTNAMEEYAREFAEMQANPVENRVMPKIMEIIDEEIKVDTKMNEIFDTDAWWWHKRSGDKFESNITRTLERIKAKITKQFSPQQGDK